MRVCVCVSICMMTDVRWDDASTDYYCTARICAHTWSSSLPGLLHTSVHIICEFVTYVYLEEFSTSVNWEFSIHRSDLFIWVTWLIFMCDMPHLFVWHDSFTNWEFSILTNSHFKICVMNLCHQQGTQDENLCHRERECVCVHIQGGVES